MVSPTHTHQTTHADTNKRRGASGRYKTVRKVQNSAAVQNSTYVGIHQHFLHGRDAFVEQVTVEVLKAGAGDFGMEVNAFVQRVDLNVRSHRRRQQPFRLLARRSQPAKRDRESYKK